jgi:hypothetical protein
MRLIIKLITTYQKRMTILKVEKTSPQGRLIGTYFGDRIYDYLCLYCAAKGTTKSRILNKLILDFISTQKTQGNGDLALIRQIIEKIKVQRAKHPDRNIDEFREKIEAELIKKGLTLDVIAKILIEIN